VPHGAPFPLQLPNPDAEIPSRSELDVMATHISRSIHDESDAEAAMPAEAGLPR
jgi:hypothetical protein